MTLRCEEEVPEHHKHNYSTNKSIYQCRLHVGQGKKTASVNVIVQTIYMCHIVSFEFTGRVQIQNLQYDNCFVVAPT